MTMSDEERQTRQIESALLVAARDHGIDTSRIERWQWGVGDPQTIIADLLLQTVRVSKQAYDDGHFAGDDEAELRAYEWNKSLLRRIDDLEEQIQDLEDEIRVLNGEITCHPPNCTWSYGTFATFGIVAKNGVDYRIAMSDDLVARCKEPIEGSVCMVCRMGDPHLLAVSFAFPDADLVMLKRHGHLCPRCSEALRKCDVC